MASEAFDEVEGADFVASCRDEMLANAWSALRKHECDMGQPYYALLEERTRNPDSTTEQLAEALSRRRSGQSVLSPAALRKTLQRARMRFSDLLLDEVARMLGTACPSRDALEREVIELGLHAYCRSALDRRFPPA